MLLKTSLCAYCLISYLKLSSYIPFKCEIHIIINGVIGESNSIIQNHTCFLNCLCTHSNFVPLDVNIMQECDVPSGFVLCSHFVSLIPRPSLSVHSICTEREGLGTRLRFC